MLAREVNCARSGRLKQLKRVVLPAPFGLMISPGSAPTLPSNEILPKATIPPKRTDNLREENHACLLTFSPAHSAQVESRDFRAALQLE
jgi:hypothetical protein